MNRLRKLTQIILKENLQKKDIATTFIWYHFITYNSEISINEINDYFINSTLPKYNITYLKRDLRLSKNVIKGSKANTYKPAHQYNTELSEKYPFATTASEDIITDDIILPNSLISSTRGYIESLGKQINGSYHHNIFDGCAILMRRLLEILLVHSFEVAGQIDKISDKEGFKNLSYIISYTLSNKPFILSKEASETLDDFRQLGNFSAHKITYNARRKDIDNVKLKYRLTIEELLYVAKIKK